MSKRRKKAKERELTREELERQQAEELPDREVMSVITPTIAPEPVIGVDGYLVPPRSD